MEKVAIAVRELDVQGITEKAKQIVRVDSIAKKLDDEIKKLTSLVDGLMVRELFMARSIHNADPRRTLRLRQFCLPRSPSKLVLSCNSGSILLTYRFI